MAVSIDPFDHRPILDFDLMFGWIDAVLTARLPATREMALSWQRMAGGSVVVSAC